GRSGLGNTSKGDRQVWQAYSTDLGRLDDDCELILDNLKPNRQHDESEVGELAEPPASFVGETQQAVVYVRKRQDFFRRSVLASYDGKCCMSGVTTPELLIASHIVPWASDAENRLNPRNGLCLSAIHDKAFDRGLITVTPDFSIRVSEKIRQEGQRTKLGKVLLVLEGEKIIVPKRFLPAPEFLQWHNDVLFEKPINEPYDI
ncbi:MAG: HNH endonuclease, partial [Parvibaculum sp.]